MAHVMASGRCAKDALAQLANLESGALFLPAKIAADQPYHLSTYVIFGGSTRAAGVNFNVQYPALTTQTHQVVIRRTEAPAAEDGALPPPAMSWSPATPTKAARSCRR